jgi:hypothetical protein
VPPDFAESSIYHLSNFTPTTTPLHILQHKTPGAVYIGICKFIAREEKIAERE